MMGSKKIAEGFCKGSLGYRCRRQFTLATTNMEERQRWKEY